MTNKPKKLHDRIIKYIQLIHKNAEKVNKEQIGHL